MTTSARRSGLAAADRYSLQLRLLGEPNLAKWFISVCAGHGNAHDVDATTLALLEAGRIVKNTNYGVTLAPEGRQFARDLSLIPPASDIELNPRIYFEDESLNPRINFDDVSLHKGEQINIVDSWYDYKDSGSDDLRNELMIYYLPLVEYNAKRIHSKLPDEVDIDDLRSAGIFGLMDAIDAFDVKRGIKFESYCAPRIRGAILDQLRSMDWVPRLLRSRTSQTEQARESLYNYLGRMPTDEELCQKMGLDQAEFAKARKDTGAVDVVSLSRKWFKIDPSREPREIDELKDDRQVNPFEVIQKRDLKDLITKGLSRAERMIVILYYYEEMTMNEIATSLDLSESRVSIMHSSILARLKAQLQHRSNDLETDTG